MLSATTLPTRFGSGSGEWESVTYHNGIEWNDPVDTYLVQLHAGDVLNVTVDQVSGDAPESLILKKSNGQVLMHTQDPIPALPLQSPLSVGKDIGLAYVISTDGRYQIDVGAYPGTSGKYNIDFDVFRPALEKQSVGARQVLFLDFDGARINPSALFGDGVSEMVELSPLSEYLGDFGLVGPNATDSDRGYVENQLISKITNVVRENLLLDIGRSGANRLLPGGDSRGAFDLLIVDSRGGYDPWGQTNVSRVIIGGGNSQTGIISDVAESVDVGNMVTNETALVQVEAKTRLIHNPRAIPINPDLPDQQAASMNLIATYIGNAISHEAGHLFGLYHTEDTNRKHDLMDQSQIGFLGDDGIYGTSDDLDIDFGVDDFQVSTNEFFSSFTKGGYASGADWMSFSLSTGTVVRGDANGDGTVNAQDVNMIGLNWNQSVTPQKDGDLNGDGVVNAIDLNQLGLGWPQRS